MKSTLGRLASIQIGYQATGRIEDDPEGGYRIVQSRDCPSDGTIRWDALYRMTPQRKKLERYTLRDGAVLFLAKGGRNTAAALRNPPPHVLAVSTFYILRVADEDTLWPEYLAWFLNNAAREYLSAEARLGTTIPFIALGTLGNMVLDLPPVGVQRRVAALDELLRRERRLTSQLLDRRTQLVTMIAKHAITIGEG